MFAVMNSVNQEPNNSKYSKCPSGQIHRLRIWFFNDINLKWALDMSISLKFKENGMNRNKKPFTGHYTN